MSGHSGFDLANVVAQLIVALVVVVVMIGLIPILFHAVWSILPGVLIMVFIVSVLRGMVKKLLG